MRLGGVLFILAIVLVLAGCQTDEQCYELV